MTGLNPDRNAGGEIVGSSTGGGSELARQFGCMACPKVTSAIVGPAFRELAQRYRTHRADKPAQDAQMRLLNKNPPGGSAAWGAVPMPAQLQLSESVARVVVEWILAGAN